MANYGGDIQTAGAYKITKMVLRSQVTEEFTDIRAMFSGFEIYEDIFSPYCTAKVYMVDGVNLCERFKIRGQEILEVEIGTDLPNIKPIIKSFRVIKLDNQKIDDNQRGQQYVLHLMSEGGFFNHTEHCGYSVKGHISDMVGTIFEKHFSSYVWLGKINIQETKDDFCYALPQPYSPFDAIEWLSHRAISGIGSEYSPYLFYETVDGYNFRSLSSIIESGEAKKDKYYFMSPNVNRNMERRETVAMDIKSQHPLKYHEIQTLQETSRFDMLENISSGMISSRLVVHDLITKQQRVHRFKESDVFSEIKKLGNSPILLEPSMESNEFFANNKGVCYYYLPNTTFTNYNSKNKITDNFRTEEYFLRRKYLIGGLYNHKIDISIFGDSEKRVGDLITLSVPNISADQHVREDKSDKNLSGDYMITHIRHVFGKSYSCVMECSANCPGV